MLLPFRFSAKFWSLCVWDRMNFKLLFTYYNLPFCSSTQILCDLNMHSLKFETSQSVARSNDVLHLGTSLCAQFKYTVCEWDLSDVAKGKTKVSWLKKSLNIVYGIILVLETTTPVLRPFLTSQDHNCRNITKMPVHCLIYVNIITVIGCETFCFKCNQ